MSGKKPTAVSEKERLQTEAAEFAARERTALERVEALRRRKDEIRVEAVEAGRSGDVARLDVLQSELASLPSALSLAEDALSGAREVHAAKSSELSAIVREEMKGRLHARRSELAADDDANAQAIRDAVAALGRALSVRDRLGDEVAALGRQLANLGEGTPGVRPAHEVLEEGRLALQRAGAREARQVVIPLLS
jgi:predicted ribonuclease YlaK